MIQHKIGSRQETQRDHERPKIEAKGNLAGIRALALLLHRRKGAPRAEAFRPVKVAICVLPSWLSLHLA